MDAGGPARTGQNSVGTKSCSKAGASGSAERHSRQCHSAGDDTSVVKVVTLLSTFLLEAIIALTVHLPDVAVCCVVIVLQVLLACFGVQHSCLF